MKKRSPILLALGFVLAFAGCGGDDGGAETATPTPSQTAPEPTPTEAPTTETGPTGPHIVRVAVVNASPQGGIVREMVKQGDRVVLSIRSDVADEVHLHGYDISRDVAAGGTATIRFRAKIPGRFEVELEQRGVQIAELTVAP